jgi:hypothetical protein
MSSKKKKAGKKPAIKLGALGQLARRAVKTAQRNGGTGPEKGKAARVMFATWLDESFTGGPGAVGQIAEALDGPAGHLIGLLVQGVYEDLKAGKGL